MLENNQEGQENAVGESQPFNPNDTARIVELEAKFENKENPEEALSQARDIVEFWTTLQKMSSYNDDIAGSISVDRFRDTVHELNMDLGQATGLARDNGSFSGTPERIVNEVYTKISSLPPGIQKMYQPLVNKYLSEKRNELGLSA